MVDDAPDDYEVIGADDSDGEPTPPPTPPPRPTLPGAPGRPLPRMWKSGDDADPTPPRAPGPAPEPTKKPEPPAPPRGRSSRDSADAGWTRKAGVKPKPSADEEKKILVEDTPVLDTYEARQRVRLGTGALLVFVIGLGCYIFYSAFLYDPFPMGPLPDADEELAVEAPPPPRADVEGEARAMLARARDVATNGQRDQAVALLSQLAKSYRNTRAAAEANQALERASRGFPPFSKAATLAATAPPAPQPAPAPTRPAAAVEPVTPAAPVRRLPSGFTAADDAVDDPSGWPSAIVGDRDDATMVLVPGGVFPMGDDRDPAASPSHKVRLSTFYIDRHEVTVGQFKTFLEDSRYRGKSTSSWPQLSGKPPAPDDHPIVMVTHADALAYADWARKTLPTEAQWEAAARSADGRVHPWGDDPPQYAGKRQLRQIDAVMAFPEDRSPFGAFDLAGNALEWTADAWDRDYYRALAAGTFDDPTGPQVRGRFDAVVRGGKGNGAGREPIDPGKRLTYVGFRCALPVERPETPVAAPTAPPPTSPTPAAPPTSAPPVVPF